MSSQKGKYKKVEVLPTHPEWRFLWKYFYHDKPHRWGIGRIYCIHERHQQQTFELNLSSIEREAEKFKPNWTEEPHKNQRAQVIQHWKEATALFSPFSHLESDGRRRDWKETRILPLWHGTSKPVADSIADSGFVYFGKSSIGTDASKPKSTDEGYFGSGIYFTNSARYTSDIYSSGHILLAWVSMREPFPVAGDPKQEDMMTLRGRGAYKDYNAHYVPVASCDPSNAYAAVYYPVQEGKSPHCDEVVVFHKSQTLPRFWIELQVESPYLMTPSVIPQFVEDFIPHLFKMLENSSVDSDKKLRNYLGEELAILLKLKGDDYLDDYGDKYETLYKNLTQLIDVQGKANRQISRIIVGAPVQQTAPSTSKLTLTSTPSYSHSPYAPPPGSLLSASKPLPHIPSHSYPSHAPNSLPTPITSTINLASLSTSSPFYSLMTDKTVECNQLKTVPVKEFIDALHKEPHQAALYCNLARILSSNESVTLLNGTRMTEQQLFLKAINLDPNCFSAYNSLDITVALKLTFSIFLSPTLIVPTHLQIEPAFSCLTVLV